MGHCAGSGCTPHPECGLGVKAGVSTRIPGGYEGIHYPQKRLSGESEWASQAVQKMPWEMERRLFGSLMVVRGRSRVRSPACGVNFPLAPKEGAPRLSHLLAQIWGRDKGRRWW